MVIEAAYRKPLRGRVAHWQQFTKLSYVNFPSPLLISFPHLAISI